MNRPPSLLLAQEIAKSYATRALNAVDFRLEAGEIHAIVGENGAGKSTLAGVLAGRIQAERGTMRLRGTDYAPRDQGQARRLGVCLVPQDLPLVGNLTVAERLLLDRLPHRWGWIDYRRLHELARQILAEVGLPDVNPARPMHSLGLGPQQLIALGACLRRGCQALILDEPTAALTEREAERLFGRIRALRDEGVGVVYISHRLEEVLKLANRVTVLRDGRKIGTYDLPALSLDELVRLLAGRAPAAEPPRPARTQGKTLLRVEALRRPPALREVSFELHRGEILGLAGLMGAGRTEALRAIFGADTPASGVIYLRESAVPATIRSPRDAVRQGIALLTENRQEQGLLLPWTVRANITLAGLSRVSRYTGWIRDRLEDGVAAQWMRRLLVRGASAEQGVHELSGGNQQKVLLARWLFRDCDILLFDEPTRGIDVAAKAEIHRHLLDLAAHGKAIVVASSDLGELLALCDRIGVMYGGRLTRVLHRGAWTQETLLRAIAGVGAPVEAEPF